MTKEEILSGIEKLQHRWQFHAVEHREKRDNNSPSYNAHQHGIAIGYLKALNTFSDWIRRLDTEKDLAEDFHAGTLIGDKDYEVIHTNAYGCGDEMHTTEISVETEMFKPGQKVKVIIVNDE